MNRVKIKDLKDKAGEKVKIAGWVDVRRDHGKLIFIDFRDSTGRVQAVALPQNKEAHKVAQELRPEWVVEVTGNVNERPEKMVNANEVNGSVEVEITCIEIISHAQELPFELGADLNLDTHLDHLPLTLRHPKNMAIFKVQSEILKAFRKFLDENGFTEFQAPKLIGEDAEGGASVFDLDYFGKVAHLAQSPQLYKQIMVGIFERVYTVGNVFRAEKHSTTRHLNEYTSMDFEFGFIKNHTDVMDMTGDVLRYINKHLKKECVKEFEMLDAEFPKIPKHIPHIKLRDAQNIIRKNYDDDVQDEPDLEPQHERWISEHALKEHNSDFIFVTHFPMSKRPMYTYEDPNDKGYANGFDLLFRGVEIVTGSQRVHDYEELVKRMKEKNLDPEKFLFYLQSFKYGMPPHGGIGMGLERLTEKFLGLDNVKLATLFPREINRIDTLLSKPEKKGGES